MFDAVTCAIPSGKRPSQVQDNCAAADLPPLSSETMAQSAKFTSKPSKNQFITSGKDIRSSRRGAIHFKINYGHRKGLFLGQLHILETPF